jgi:serine/threonine protein kinase
MNKKGTMPRCPNCGWIEGTIPESPQHLTPGTMLHGKYLVGRVLGQGGFGITYLGWDLQLDMKLAIKEYMPRDFATRNTGEANITFFTGNVKYLFDNGLHKFLEEARILAKYNNHPGIVSVRDFFKENGTAYLVMYYLDGIDLKKYLEQVGGRLTYEQALSILSPVIDALSTVHRDGILHRDISPDNIYITTNREVKLLDFGAARHAMNDSNKSLSVILKPGYAPEEQYRSKGKQGPWTDIYATAATMYRVITGVVPPESLDRLEEDTLVPPSQLGVSIPPYAEAALIKALSLKAQDRFQSMELFQLSLKEPSQNSITPHIQQQQLQQNHSNSIQHVSNDQTQNQEGVQTVQPIKKKKTGLIVGAVIGGLFLLFCLFIGFLFILGSGAEDDPTSKTDSVTNNNNNNNNNGGVNESVQVSVPLLYNLTAEEAKAELEKVGLKVGKVIQQKDLFSKKGRVFVQSIKADTKKGKNTQVDITVNSGVKLPVDTATIQQQGMALIYQYVDQANALYDQKKWEQALEGYTQTREMVGELLKAKGLSADVFAEARLTEANLADTMSSLKIELGYPYYALEDSNDNVAILTELQKQNMLSDLKLLGNAYGNLAWIQLLNKLPEDAINSLQQAVNYEPNNILIQVNLAHAYLLTDHFRDAFKLYRANKDLELNGQKISTIIADDLEKLKKAGYDHPDIDVINVNMLGVGVDTDEKQIQRTINYQTDAEFAGDLEGYLSTFAYEPGSKQYTDLTNNFKNLFSNYVFTAADVKELTIENQTADQATVIVTKSFKYNDSNNKEFSEEVTYKFILKKTNSSLPWRIAQLEVVKK